MLTLPFCPEAVIFDMDGLLVNSEPVWEAAEDALLARHGCALSPEMRAPFIGQRMHDFWSGLTRALGLSTPVDVLVQEVVEQFLLGLPAGVPEQPGASALIALLQAQGVPIAVASSSPLAVIDGEFGARGWMEAFPTRVSGDEVPQGKPAPDVYLEACRRLGADPRRALALEDSRNGVRAAVAAGMMTVAVPDLSHTPRAEFDALTPYIADSLHDVRAALQHLGCLAG